MKFPHMHMILLTILHMHVLIEGQTLIETTCKNTPNYQLCISTLHAHPSSSSTDVAGLGLIMVDAVKAKSESAVSSIDMLRRLHPGQQTSELENCLNVYNAVLRADVPEAVAALTKGDPKFAEFGMTDAAWEAEICEGGFDDGQSPLSGVNKEVGGLAGVANGIVRSLL